MTEKTRYTDSELEEFRQIIEEKILKAENDLVLIKSAYTNDSTMEQTIPHPHSKGLRRVPKPFQKKKMPNLP